MKTTYRLMLAHLPAILLLLSTVSVNAGPNLLSDNWISCSNNNRIRSFNANIGLDSECIYQEVNATPSDNLELVCQTTTSDFTSTQLAYSQANFRVLRSSIDTTRTSTTLRVSMPGAPDDTRYAVATLYANSTANMNCTLSRPDSVTVEPTGIGPCIDSDNDGFGWNGVATCRTITQSPPVNSSATRQTQVSTVSNQVCADPDNDGYGWDGTRSCLVSDNQSNSTEDRIQTAAPASAQPSDTNTRSATGNVAGPCVDADNDGYGWNGVASCTLNVSVSSNSINPTSNPRTSGTPGIADLTDLILVTGQSNAQGNNSTADLAILDASNNQVFAYTDNNTWQVADLRQHWDGPNEIRHPGNNALIFPTNAPHNNFAFHFGKALVTLDPQRVVGFVLITAPGAGIKHWDQDRSFYRSLSGKAMNALNASSKSSFDGILWHQGETDFQFNGTSDITATSLERVDENYYPDRLYRLISNLRQEPWFSTQKPIFICAETQTTNPDPLTIAPVNRRLMALNSDSDPYTGCVSSSRLQTTDGIHFNAASMREIGRRYAIEYLKLQRR